MAQRPGTFLEGGQGGGTPPPPAIRPDYKIITDISGGLNVSRPPDQIADNESPDLLNLVYVNRVMCVDFGFKAFGSPVLGVPQQPITWIDNGNVEHTFLVTTRTIYIWDNALLDWALHPFVTAGDPASNAPVAGTGANPAIPFPGTAHWLTGEPIGVQMDNGHWLVGPAGGTTSPVTIGSPLPVGRSIPSGRTIWSGAGLTADGQRPVSWASDPGRNILIVVNGHDVPLAVSPTNFIALGGLSGIPLTAANYVARYHGVTVLGGTVEGGTAFPYRIRRSATGDSTNWTTLDSGFDDLIDTNDAITGLMVVNPYLIVLRADSIVRASYYGIGLQVFWYDYALDSTGTIGAQAFDSTKVSSVIVSESGVYQYTGDYGLTDLGEKVFNSFLSYSGELNPATEDVLFVQYVPILDETWIFYADGKASFPNTILRYVHKTGAWFRRRFAAPLAIVGVGFFKPQAATRWIDLLGSRWIDRHKAWNSRVNLQNYNSILLCGAAGQVFLYDFNKTTTDAGTPIPWYFVSKDYPLPENWQTLDGLAFYGKGIVDLVEISTDYGVTWHQLGSAITLGPTWARADVSCSLTAQFVRIRFSGMDPSFKLSWFAFKTMYASER